MQRKKKEISPIRNVESNTVKNRLVSLNLENLHEEHLPPPCCLLPKKNGLRTAAAVFPQAEFRKVAPGVAQSPKPESLAFLLVCTGLKHSPTRKPHDGDKIHHKELGELYLSRID